MNKKILAILSIIFAVIGLLMSIITPNDVSIILIEWIIAFILEVIAIILGFISRDEAKKLCTISIIIGIATSILVGFSLLGLSMIKRATNCVDKGDGTSTCEIFGNSIDIDNNLLNENQMKK